MGRRATFRAVLQSLSSAHFGHRPSFCLQLLRQAPMKRITPTSTKPSSPKEVPKTALQIASTAAQSTSSLGRQTF
jgi:hypothetical protein